MDIKRRIFVAIVALAAMLAGLPVAPASATANGELCVWVRYDSTTPVTVQWVNYSGVTYNDPVYPNTIEGEVGCEAVSLAPSGNLHAQPHYIHVTQGYCNTSRISTNGGYSWGSSVVIGPNARWLSVYPGDGWNYPWLVQVRGYSAGSDGMC